jgi:hypothetical protein
MSRPDTAAGLRRWAEGSYAYEAAVELLIRAFNGRFARPGWPWIADTSGELSWLDAAQIAPDTTGALSGGERRLLAVVAALAGEQPADISEVAGLDRDLLDLVLAAIAHAGGSHQHSDIRSGSGGRPEFARLPPLHPWPPLTPNRPDA